MEEGVNSLLIKFADDTKTGTVATTKEQVLQIQKDLDRLWKWAGDNKMAFNVDKCKVLHLGHRNSCHKYRTTNCCIESLSLYGFNMLALRQRVDMATYAEEAVGDPLQWSAWVGQCALYIVIMIFEKTIIIIVLQIPQWKEVALLNLIENPQLELAIVMLIVPFFVNALMFWVVDNFLMKKGKTKAKLEEKEPGLDSRNGSKVRYRRAASHEESESEASPAFPKAYYDKRLRKRDDVIICGDVIAQQGGIKPWQKLKVEGKGIEWLLYEQLVSRLNMEIQTGKGTILISADDEMEESDGEEDLRRLTNLKSFKKKKHRFGLPV
ncbi:Store-operated calcium entry regulator STIMATE [Varanus komodoensis]|nr:Store-operated calcium entry regulator STIMATE [Varanus komodoensis]